MPPTCVYTNFDLHTLWGTALTGGCILFLESAGLLWRKYIVKQHGWTLLLFAIVVLMSVSFALAFAISGHTLGCGNNLTGKEISIDMAMTFQYLVISILVASCVLVLIGLGPILEIFSRSKRR